MFGCWTEKRSGRVLVARVTGGKCWVVGKDDDIR